MRYEIPKLDGQSDWYTCDTGSLSLSLSLQVYKMMCKWFKRAMTKSSSRVTYGGVFILAELQICQWRRQFMVNDRNASNWATISAFCKNYFYFQSYLCIWESFWQKWKIKYWYSPNCIEINWVFFLKEEMWCNDASLQFFHLICRHISNVIGRT